MEEELFHTTHDNVGALLAKKWKFTKTEGRGDDLTLLVFSRN